MTKEINILEVSIMDQAGMTQAEIAAHFGTTQATISRRLRKFKLRGAHGGKRHAPVENQNEPTSLIENLLKANLTPDVIAKATGIAVSDIDLLIKNKNNGDIVLNNKIVSQNEMTRGEALCEWIEAHCKVPEGKLMGQAIKLAPFQRKFIIDVFDNKVPVRRAILSMARKNAKTALIACLVLAFLCGTIAIKNSRIISVAMSREQAAEVFNLASKMIYLSEHFSNLLKVTPSGKKITCAALGTEYQAIAADPQRAHGKSPYVLIMDEVGQIKGAQNDFIDAMTTAQGAYENPIQFIISTQAANDSDLLSLWIDDAINNPQEDVICHVYAANKDADLMDEQAWRDANPALGLFRSEKDLRTQAEEAMRIPSKENAFRNLILNQRVSMHSPFISRRIWDQNKMKAEIEKCSDVYVGIDLSMRHDLTAIVCVGVDDDDNYHVETHAFVPIENMHERERRDKEPYSLWVKQGFLRAVNGFAIDYEIVAQELREILDRLPVREVAYDRWNFNQFKSEMERAGVIAPLVEFGQGYRSMSAAVSEIEVALLASRVRHGDNPILNMCAKNAVVIRDAAGGRKLDKSKSYGRIDALVAMTMAISRASQRESQRMLIM